MSNKADMPKDATGKTNPNRYGKMTGTKGIHITDKDELDGAGNPTVIATFYDETRAVSYMQYCQKIENLDCCSGPLNSNGRHHESDCPNFTFTY